MNIGSFDFEYFYIFLFKGEFSVCSNYFLFILNKK